jgi:hypothetical protein
MVTQSDGAGLLSIEVGVCNLEVAGAAGKPVDRVVKVVIKTPSTVVALVVEGGHHYSPFIHTVNVT